MRRHPWLPSLLITRSVLGPNGLVLLEHVLKALAPHAASLAAKLEAFAILSTTTALFVQNELGGDPPHRDRVQALPVSGRDGGGRDLRAGALRRAPGGRVLGAHPDDVPGFLRCHSASRRVAGRTPYFANAVPELLSYFANTVCEG